MSEEEIVQAENQEVETQEAGDQENFEELAAKFGWSPKERWKGDEGKWVDAKTFYERMQNVLPVYKERYESRVARLEDVISRMARANDAALEHQRAEHLKELKEARRKAIATSDGEAFDKADEEIRKVESEVRKDEKDPEIENWLSENDWYEKDPELQGVADAISKKLRKDNPDLSARKFLDRLGQEVKRRFPEKFENPRRKSSAVEGGGSRNSKPNKFESFDSLPQEAKQAFERIHRKMPKFTKEQYLKSYLEEGK